MFSVLFEIVAFNSELIKLSIDLSIKSYFKQYIFSIL